MPCCPRGRGWCPRARSPCSPFWLLVYVPDWPSTGEREARTGPMRFRHGRIAAVQVAAAVLLLPACSVIEEEAVLDGETLTGGGKYDQPGLGQEEDEALDGCEVGGDPCSGAKP